MCPTSYPLSEVITLSWRQTVEPIVHTRQTSRFTSAPIALPHGAALKKTIKSYVMLYSVKTNLFADIKLKIT